MNRKHTLEKSEKRAGRRVLALFSLFSVLSLTAPGCSLFKDRPLQLMSDTGAALRAAREVSADSLAPEKYRRATEAYFRAQNEYRMKNFAIAEDYAVRAKRLAEEAEFDALNQGSPRTSLLPPDVPPPPPTPSTYEQPEGEMASEMIRKGTTVPNAPTRGASSPSSGQTAPNSAPNISP